MLDDLVRAGKLQHYGVSVEKVEEARQGDGFPQRADACRSSSTCSATARGAVLSARGGEGT